MGSASGVPALQVERVIDEAKETQTDHGEVLLIVRKKKGTTDVKLSWNRCEPTDSLRR